MSTGFECLRRKRPLHAKQSHVPPLRQRLGELGIRPFKAASVAQYKQSEVERADQVGLAVRARYRRHIECVKIGHEMRLLLLVSTILMIALTLIITATLTGVELLIYSFTHLAFPDPSSIPIPFLLGLSALLSSAPCSYLLWKDGVEKILKNRWWGALWWFLPVNSAWREKGLERAVLENPRISWETTWFDTYADEIPRQVRERKEAIEKLAPFTLFRIEYATPKYSSQDEITRLKELGLRVSLDPFLVAESRSGERYYVAVWKEERFLLP